MTSACTKPRSTTQGVSQLLRISWCAARARSQGRGRSEGSAKRTVATRQGDTGAWGMPLAPKKHLRPNV